MVGRVDDSLREDLEQVLIAAAGQGSATIAEVTIRLGDVPPDSDEQVLLESIEGFWGYETGNHRPIGTSADACQGSFKSSAIIKLCCHPRSACC